MHLCTLTMGTRDLVRTSSPLHSTLALSQLLLTVLLLADMHLLRARASFLPKVEVITRSNTRSKLLHNSPIFYLKVSPNLRNNANHKKGPSASSLFGKRTSNLYKLPLQFMSNAKPVDIIQGIAGKVSSKDFTKVPYRRKLLKHKYSKVFHLPTKFVSNGKPIKPFLLRGKFHSGLRIRA